MEDRSYNVAVVDRTTGQVRFLNIDSPCPHEMQSFVEELVASGQVHITDPVVVSVRELDPSTVRRRVLDS